MSSFSAVKSCCFVSGSQLLGQNNKTAWFTVFVMLLMLSCLLTLVLLTSILLPVAAVQVQAVCVLGWWGGEVEANLTLFHGLLGGIKKHFFDLVSLGAKS